MKDDDLFIPANPLIHSEGINEARMANQDLSLRDRQVKRVFIPAPPVAEQIPVPPPAQRRNFGSGPQMGGRPVRKED